MNSNRGLTLIELLIVIMIVAILAGVAIPIYTNYMQRARRVDGKTALEQLRAAQEMFRAERGRYSNDGDDGNAILLLQKTWGVPATSGDYNLSFVFCNANTFTAQADPFTARQQSDKKLFINQDGRKWDEDGLVWPQGKWAK